MKSYICCYCGRKVNEFGIRLDPSKYSEYEDTGLTMVGACCFKRWNEK